MSETSSTINSAFAKFGLKKPNLVEEKYKFKIFNTELDFSPENKQESVDKLREKLNFDLKSLDANTVIDYGKETNKHTNHDTGIGSNLKSSKKKLRIVCISDTHNKFSNLANKNKNTLPKGDILIHAGDISMYGELEELEKFDDWLSFIENSKNHNFKHIIVIAGNRDMHLDKIWTDLRSKESLQSGKYDEKKVKAKEKDYENIRTFMKDKNHRKRKSNFIYLEDESITLENYNFYGSPTSLIGGSKSGFKKPENSNILDNYWKKIPSRTDILITHGPPFSVHDHTNRFGNIGDPILLKHIVERIKPKLHIFGHIHEDPGVKIYENSDQSIIFGNATCVNNTYSVCNSALVFDLDVKE